MSDTEILVRDSIAFLHQGLALIEGIEDADYRRPPPLPQASSVGAHLRHVLDHYQCLLRGIPGGVVDYDLRERDAQVESVREAGLAHLRSLTQSLSPLARLPADYALGVRLSTAAGHREHGLTASTLGRELQYLVSHTVHHYAVIALLLRFEQVAVPEDFGLSPSTLAFLRSGGRDVDGGRLQGRSEP